MPEQERLERPQASLLKDIETEMAEEAAQVFENVEELLKWKRIHARMSVHLIPGLIFGLLFLALVAAISLDVAIILAILLALIIVAMADGAFFIALLKPDIFSIDNEGNAKNNKAAKFGFYAFWLAEGMPFLVITVIAIIWGITLLF